MPSQFKQGLSVSSSIIHGEKFLVAFGGYNGKYNNEVHVLSCDFGEQIYT